VLAARATRLAYSHDLAEIETKTGPLERVRVLKPGAEADEIGEALREAAAGLKGKDKLSFALGRDECLKKLKELQYNAPGKIVDAAFQSDADTRKPENGESIRLSDPEPWPDPVEGTELLQEIKTTIERYVVLPWAIGNCRRPLGTPCPHPRSRRHIALPGPTEPGEALRKDDYASSCGHAVTAPDKLAGRLSWRGWVTDPQPV